MPPIYTTVFLPRDSHEWRSLADYSPWGCKESDKTEWLHLLRNNKSTLILSISPTPKGKVNFMSCPHGNTTKTHLWEWRCPFPHSIRQVVHTVTDLKKSRVGALPVPEVWDPDLTPNHPSFHHLRCEHLEGRHCGQEWRGWLNTTTQGMLTFVSEWHGSCLQLSSVQFISATLGYLTLWNPISCSLTGFPVHHQHPELAQTHVHWDVDAVQPSRSLSSPSPPAFNLSQHQGLF